MPTNNTKRRLALKALGGSALAGSLTDKLPAIWQRPLVHSAALPAHAQASPLPLGNITLMLRDPASGGALSFNVQYELQYSETTPREVTHVYFGTQRQIAVHESRPGLLDAMFPAAHAQAVTTDAPARLTGSVDITRLTTIAFERTASRVQTGMLQLRYNQVDCPFEITVELLRDRSAIYQITAETSTSCGDYIIEAPTNEDGSYMEGSGFGVITEPADRSLVRPQGEPEMQSPITFRVGDLVNQSQGVAQVDWFVFYHPITGQATGIGFGDITTEQDPEQMSGRFGQIFPAAYAQGEPSPDLPSLGIEGSVQYLHFDGFAETSNMDAVGFVLNGQSARVPILAERQDAPAMPQAATTPGVSPRQAVSLRLMNRSALTDVNLDFGLFPQSGLNDARGNPITPVSRAQVSKWLAENVIHTISFVEGAYSGNEGEQVTVRLTKQGPGAITFNLERAGTAGNEDARIGMLVADIPVTLPPGTQPVPMNLGQVTLSVAVDDYKIDVDLLVDTNDAEGPETVTLMIENPTVAGGQGRVRIGDIGQADITIVDTAVPQPSADRPWVGWAQTAYEFDEPPQGTIPANYVLDDFGTRPGPEIMRYESAIRVQFSFSPPDEPGTTPSLTGDNAISVYFRVTDGPGVESGTDVRGFDLGDDYRLNATVRPDGLLVLRGSPYTIDVDVLRDMANEGYETVTLTLELDPNNSDAYIIDPDAVTTVITLVNNPEPTTPTPPTPGPTVAMTTPALVERTFSWTWGSATDPIAGTDAGDGNTYYVIGELVTESPGVIQTEALATSHTYQVYQNGRLLYTVDLKANTVDGENGIMEMGAGSRHDFRFNSNADSIAFSLNPPINSVKSNDFPVNLSVGPEAGVTIGLYYDRREDSVGWHLVGLQNNNVLVSGEPTNPVIMESIPDPDPVVLPSVTTTSGPRSFMYEGTIDHKIRGMFTLRADAPDSGTINATHLASHTLTVFNALDTDYTNVDFVLDLVNEMITINMSISGDDTTTAAIGVRHDFEYVIGTNTFVQSRTTTATQDIAVAIDAEGRAGASGTRYGIRYVTSGGASWALQHGDGTTVFEGSSVADIGTITIDPVV